MKIRKNKMVGKFNGCNCYMCKQKHFIHRVKGTSWALELIKDSSL